MNKESEAIIKMINNQKQIEDLKIRGEKEQQERQIAEEKSKKEFFLRKSEEVMGKLGIIQIFEELRNSGVVKYSDKRPLYGERKTLFGKKESVIVKPYIPAQIDFGEESISISMKFDEYYDWRSENWYPKVVSVGQTEANKIIVKGYGITNFEEQAESREKIPGLIAKAILKVQGKADNSK